MSKPAEHLFSVTLKHLSSDAKKAGAELPEAQLYHVSVKQMRSLLDAAAALAPSVAYPAEPELRITGSLGKFVVQLKNGSLNFVSWSSSKRPGGQMTPARIIAAITGEEDEEEEVVAPRGGGGAARRSGGGRASEGKSTMTIAALVVAIIAVNSFTVWFMLQPARTNLPKFTLMQPGPAERLMSEVAGFYETGGSAGDRRIEIKKDGVVNRVKFGAARTPISPQTFTVLAAESGGKPALVAPTKKTLITVKDQLSIVLYGDTYQRVPQ